MYTDRHYSLLIQWDTEDHIYVVTVPELRGCMTHGRTYEEAILQAQDAIESWIGAAEQMGFAIPTPQTYRANEVKISQS